MGYEEPKFGDKQELIRKLVPSVSQDKRENSTNYLSIGKLSKDIAFLYSCYYCLKHSATSSRK